MHADENPFIVVGLIRTYFTVTHPDTVSLAASCWHLPQYRVRDRESWRKHQGTVWLCLVLRHNKLLQSRTLSDVTVARSRVRVQSDTRARPFLIRIRELLYCQCLMLGMIAPTLVQVFGKITIKCIISRIRHTIVKLNEICKHYPPTGILTTDKKQVAGDWVGVSMTITCVDASYCVIG